MTCALQSALTTLVLLTMLLGGCHEGDAPDLGSEDVLSTGTDVDVEAPGDDEGDVGLVERRAGDIYEVYLGGFHPPPPSDLPPIPAPPGDLGEGFVSLDTMMDPGPWPLFEGDGGDIPSPTSVLFGDLDGDGKSEVLISSDRRGLPGGSADWETVTSQAYRYISQDSALTAYPEIPLPVGHVLAIADLDGDGRDDLLTLGPSTVHWGGEALTNSLLLEDAGGQELLHYKAVSLADLDYDGLIDLVAQPVSCCSIACPELALITQQGRRHFQVRPELMETVNHANVCASLVAPVGHQRLLMSFAAVSTCGGRSHLFYEEVGVDAEGMPRFEALDAAGQGPTLDLSLSSPMGGSVADFDGDGDLDLTMTTDPYHVMLRAEDTWPLTNMTTWTGIGEAGLLLPPEPLAPDGYMIPWGAAALDLDRDGRVDIVYSHGADPNPGGDKLEVDVGPQHVSAHWNGGDMRFADITETLGLGHLGEWRALTVGDLNSDGAPDLGVGGLGQFPRVYRNAIESDGHGLAIRLRGTTSNALGLGAIIRVRPAAQMPEQVHVMGHIGNPYGVSQPLVFVGLGAHTEAAEVSVTWPSGLTQQLSGLSAGRIHTLVEPAIIEVSPWSRRLEAAGGASAFIEVKARDAQGEVIEAAQLELSVLSGQATLAGEGVAHEGGARWELQAPSAPGESRLEARIDGVPVGIRPRIIWY